MKLEGCKRKAVDKFITILREHLKEKLWGIYLFGSIAKGTAEEKSDIDMLIVYSNLDEHKLLEIVSEISFKVALETGELIETILMSKEDYEESVGHSPFLWEVLQFGTPLFTRLKGTNWELEFKDYIELAEEYLQYAKDAAAEDKLRLSIDSGYNACELLVKALIISTKNPLASSHGGIVGQFGKLFVLSGRASEELGRNFHLALELRAKARYRPKVQIDAGDAQFIINLARQLLDLAKRELKQ